MTSVLIEHAQYVDDAGRPLVGGKVYIGTNGVDPVASAPVTAIYSDRELTTLIANPQTLNTDGRSANKIWVSGTYSVQVNDAAAVQFFQDLDAGDDVTTTNATLFVTSIVGTGAITGVTSDPISAYTPNQQFVFETAGANAGLVTLNIDGVGAKAVVKNNDQALLPAEFAAAQVVIVAYNASNDNFELVNQNNKVIDFYEGSDVASASTANIWATDGNTVHVTGTTGITSFGTAPNVGAVRRVVFDGAVVLTNSANLALPNGANYTTSAGDIAIVYADTTTQLDVTIHKKSGGPATYAGLDAEFNASGSAPMYACRAWANFNGTGTPAIRASGNISSITDTATGQFIVNMTTAIEDADYAVVTGLAVTDDATFSQNDGELGTYDFSAGSFKIKCTDGSGAGHDPVIASIAVLR